MENVDKIEKIMNTTQKIYEKQKTSEKFFMDIQDKLLNLFDKIDKTKDEVRQQDKRIYDIERTIKIHNFLLFIGLIIFILIIGA